MTLNWTPDRPTKPGEYWVSVHPKQRVGFIREYPAKATIRKDADDRLLVSFADGFGGICWGDLNKASVYDGALWAPRETPEDPFKEVGT